MKSLAFVVVFTLLLFFAAAPCALADAPQAIGAVVSAQGTWCDEAHLQCQDSSFHGLWKMYPVQMDSKLVRLGQISGHEVLVIRSRWGVLETFDCSTPRELGCKSSLNLARMVPAQPQKNVYTALFDAVTELASAQPKVYDNLRQGFLRTRGPGSRLADGVVEWREDGLNLESVFADYGARDFLLELGPLSDAAEPQCPAQPAVSKYSWDPAHPAAFPATGIQPGLYRLYLCQDLQGAAQRTTFYADLLIAPPARYRELVGEYQQVFAATRDWDADDPTAPAMRRAYLYELARR